jgi:hypothetical protein
VRALPVALTLMDQARARKHDTDLGNRPTDPAFGLLGRDAVLTIIGLQNAGIGTVILIRDHEYVDEDRGAPANLAGEMRAMGLHVAGGLTDGAHNHHSPDPLCGCPANCRARRRRRDRDMAPRPRRPGRRRRRRPRQPARFRPVD